MNFSGSCLQRIPDTQVSTGAAELGFAVVVGGDRLGPMAGEIAEGGARTGGFHPLGAGIANAEDHRQ